MTQDNKAIIYWLNFCCFMVFAMAVIGAITRLTESGLSIVEWHPLMGALPPLTQHQWDHVYALYKQSPEFAHKHHWMALEDFKKIFFWEWLHRLWGRTIGVVYALPLLWFWFKKKIPEGYGLKLAGIFLLGGAQGVLGWYMVMSGLVDRPEVSHFRLAAHLFLALLIFSAMWWVSLSLQKDETPSVVSKSLRIIGGIALLMLATTIVWGAFVAGLDAGMIYNTFPLMGGQFTPPETMQPFGFLHQHAWVQFAHRWLAISTAILIVIFALRTKNIRLLAMIFIQVGLGISTLLSQVYVPLAALHQAGAIVLLALLIQANHSALKSVK